jgi:hypothetical protein
MRYVFLNVFRKARRKDKEASAPGEDPKLYLEEAVLERKHGDLDLRTLVELPAGLDYNEWLASHSEYLSFSLFIRINQLALPGAYRFFCPTSPLHRTHFNQFPLGHADPSLVGESKHTMSGWVGGHSILLSPKLGTESGFSPHYNLLN